MFSEVNSDERPVVVLGAGINGAALARELVLNRVPVWLVDTADVAAGTTAYSSRLIHGGLRYLEYGEFDLVRESLAERTRLLRLAPHFVRPLRLHIPVSNRWGGLVLSARRFLGLEGRSTPAKARGLWMIRLGLSLYDTYARDPSLPRHRGMRSGVQSARGTGPMVDAERYPWVCAYYDAQVSFPERFTWSLVEDARLLAAAQRTEFKLLTYHRPRLVGKRLELVPSDPARPYAEPDADDPATASVEPALIVNATGAWVDQTLTRLRVESPALLGGTKGTHFFTQSPRLRERLAGEAVYGEADDGRPVFILPLAAGTLVGTTDQRYSGRPEDAVATPAELHYLVRLVNDVVPGVGLKDEDILWHYAGVRPLPRSDSALTASVTRRHFLHETPHAPVPLYSIVGGKLTTCRSLAEEATAALLRRLNRPVVGNSRERPLPGGEDYPPDADGVRCRIEALAERLRLPPAMVAAVWSLCGARTETILPALNDLSAQPLADTSFPAAYVRWVIRHERPRTIDDLVERRLMLLYHAPPTLACLRELGQLLAEAGLLAADELEPAIERSRQRLERHFGLRVAAEAASQAEAGAQAG